MAEAEIKTQRGLIVGALIKGDVRTIRIETLALVYFLEVLRGFKIISDDVYNEHRDFAAKVLKAVNH